MRLGGMRLGGLAAAVAMILVSGCSAAPAAGHRQLGASGPVGFWTRSRLLGAGPVRGGHRLVPSGSPWVTHFDTRSRTGTIVGVIGGYQQGGDTPSICCRCRTA